LIERKERKKGFKAKTTIAVLLNNLYRATIPVLHIMISGFGATATKADTLSQFRYHFNRSCFLHIGDSGYWLHSGILVVLNYLDFEC